jgi:hypothetical protein
MNKEPNAETVPLVDALRASIPVISTGFVTAAGNEGFEPDKASQLWIANQVVMYLSSFRAEAPSTSQLRHRRW